MKRLMKWSVPFVLFGCQHTIDTEVGGSATTDSASIESIDSAWYDDQFNENFTDTTTIINFEDFSVVLSRMIVYDEQGSLEEPVKDSISLWAELGERMEGQLIQIKSENDYAFVVEFSYQTSVSIADEGPHCDLYDWKHHTSDWVTLDEENPNEFRVIKLSEKEMSLFPEVDMQELKEAAYASCGEGWAELVGDVASPFEYPCWVGVSSHLIRITYTKGSEKIQKIIRIDLPMGC